MDRLVDTWIDCQIDGQISKQMGRLIDGSIKYRYIVKQIGRQIVKLVNIQIDQYKEYEQIKWYIDIYVSIDRQINMVDRQRNWWIYYIDSKVDRLIGRSYIGFNSNMNSILDFQE